jgi:hypothetical protein
MDMSIHRSTLCRPGSVGVCWTLESPGRSAALDADAPP